MVKNNAHDQLPVDTATEKNRSIPERQTEAWDVPKDLQCPITIELMMDPVVAADGFAYERDAIENRFKSKMRSPVTNLPLPTKQLYASQTLRSLIQDWVLKNPENSDWPAEKVDLFIKSTIRSLNANHSQAGKAAAGWNRQR